MVILLGLAAAACWSITLLCSSRAVRIIDQGSVAAWSMLVGLLAMAPMLIATRLPEALTGTTLAWWAVSGLGNVLGLLIAWAALRVGKVGLVGPVTSTEGALIALLSLLAGASVTPRVAPVLVLIAIGVVLAAVAPDPAPIAHERPLRAVVLAAIAAGLFGIGGFATGHVSEILPAVWVVAPARMVGVLILALPLAASRRLAHPGKAIPFVVAIGFAEVAGWLMWVFGARQNVVVTSVLAGLFAPIGAVAAYYLFREKLGRLQIAAVGLLVLATTALTVLLA